MTQDDRQFYQQLFEQQNLQFQRHLSAVAESFDHRLNLVVEGQQLLGEKVDRLEQRMNKVESRLEGVELTVIALEKKVDTIAADLKAHRADTEAHHGVYRVKEG